MMPAMSTTSAGALRCTVAYLLCAGMLGCGDRAPQALRLDAASCAALVEIALPDAAVATAEWSERGPAGRPLPAHCHLQGEVDRRVGRDGASYAIGFRLRLPAQWSRCFYFEGGYGSDGVISSAVGSISGGDPLARGCAVAATDAGHTGDGVEFGLDPQARADYGYRAVERVARLAKAILARTYGGEPERSYLLGCSNGGRQGFVAAQRYPDLFDGIVAGAPAFDAPRAALAAVWNSRAAAAIATERDARGRPLLGSAFSDDDLSLLAEAVRRECDARDGLADGIVDDVVGCAFDPDLVQCAVEKTSTCLDAAQVGALRAIFGGARDARGERLYAPFPWDAGIGDPSPIGSLRGWTLGPASGSANGGLDVTLVAPMLAYLFLAPPVTISDPLDFALGFDLDRDAHRIFESSTDYPESAMDYVAATSPDLSRFRRRGGKMIVYHGASDGVFSILDTVGWYEAVGAASGGDAADFARLFVVPGMGHCSGGPATDRFDAFEAIAAWVEDGVAPERLVATASASSPFPGRTRPLCPYPSQARWRGEGSVESAESFDCRPAERAPESPPGKSARERERASARTP
jgi:hypothetical protein